jgi:nucleoid-associated protein YgaU
MAIKGTSTRSILVGRLRKSLGVTVFIGMAMSSCFGDSGMTSDESVQPVLSEDSSDLTPKPELEAVDKPSDEHVAAQVSEQVPETAPKVGDVATSEAVSAPEASEQQVVALDEAAPVSAPEVTEKVPAAEQAVPAAVADAAPVAPAEAAPAAPAETFEAKTDTVDANIAENAADHATEVPATPPAEAPPAMFETKTPPPSAVADGNTVSSPGAARFITGIHEKYRSGEGHHLSRHHGGHGGNYAHEHGRHHHHAMTAAGASHVSHEHHGKMSEYVIEQGDSLASISKKIYGNTNHWESLAELNGIKAPYKIFPGDAMRFEQSDAKAQDFVKGYRTTMKTVVVESGDTLSRIANRVYGDPGAWKRLLSYNRARITDPNRIVVGMKLDYMVGAGGNSNAAAQTAPEQSQKTTHHVIRKRSTQTH